MDSISSTVPVPDSVQGPIHLPLRLDGIETKFRLWYFDFSGGRWIAALAGDLDSDQTLILRIESACIFGHVFKSAQCDCCYQLDEALRRISAKGRGLIVYALDHDARGLGVAAHFQIYVMRQQEGLDSEGVYRRLQTEMDVRRYEPVIAILHYFGVGRVCLLSNNAKRRDILLTHGIDVELEAIEAELDPSNMSTLMLEKEDLGYLWSFKTHGDWLALIQQRASDDPNRRLALLVAPTHTLLSEYDSAESWAVAEPLVRAAPETGRSDLLAYLSDLPRVDELPIYREAGVFMVVVPFAHIPDWLAMEGNRAGLRIQDWGRVHNRYIKPRPQWHLAHRGVDVDIYRRGPRLRFLHKDTSAWTELDAAGLSQADLDGWGMNPEDLGLPGYAAARAIPRPELPPNGPSAPLCVDSLDGAPAFMARFKVFNPFYVHRRAVIPVVGMPKVRARSVEAVWQGLKFVDGDTQLDMFDLPPWKRPPEEQRLLGGYSYEGSTFLYGQREIDLLSARLAIYLPTYLYLLDRLVPQRLIDQIDASITEGRGVVFYDCDANHDITDPSTSFSHSAILAAWFNGRLEWELLPAVDDYLSGEIADETRARIEKVLGRYRARQSRR